jgi:L-alanine-DL-glutamate epimerase-like enolase superfamily enzyme
MADANQALTLPEAIRLGRPIEAYDLTWFEEPLPAYDLAGCAELAAALDTPIASREIEYTRYGFRRIFELKAAAVLMPDLKSVGGVSEFVRVASRASSTCRGSQSSTTRRWSSRTAAPSYRSDPVGASPSIWITLRISNDEH